MRLRLLRRLLRRLVVLLWHWWRLFPNMIPMIFAILPAMMITMPEAFRRGQQAKALIGLIAVLLEVGVVGIFRTRMGSCSRVRGGSCVPAVLHQQALVRCDSSPRIEQVILRCVVLLSTVAEQTAVGHGSGSLPEKRRCGLHSQAGRVIRGTGCVRRGQAFA